MHPIKPLFSVRSLNLNLELTTQDVQDPVKLVQVVQFPGHC